MLGSRPGPPQRANQKVLYVLDGPAIVTVSLEVSDDNEVFMGLTDLLDDGEVCFCDEVVPELERLAKGDPALTWAKTAAPNRAYKGASYLTIEFVAQDFKEIIDTTARDTQESAALYVVAQALELRDNGVEVTVVSQDRHSKPTRASVLEACQHFGLPCITLLKFLEQVSLLEEGE